MKPLHRTLALLALTCVLLCRPQALAAEQLTPPEPAQEVLNLAPERAYQAAFIVWSRGDQRRAEALLAQLTAKHPNDQRLAFFQAALVRSRFMVREAFPRFREVAKMNAGSPEGQCAIHVMYMDGGKDVSEHFGALQDLVEAHPDDPLLLWMIAVQCRALKKNQEGVGYFRKLWGMVETGPVLLHQTFANLLDEVGLYDEALEHRRTAVSLEPAYWSYDGLGNTLQMLGRFEEAGEAYKKAIHAEPRHGGVWSNWALCLEKAGDYEGALEKANEALALDPKSDGMRQLITRVRDQIQKQRVGAN